MNNGTCTVCLTTNTTNIINDTYLQPVYEKLTGLKIGNIPCWMCHLCLRRLRLCHLISILGIHNNKMEEVNESLKSLFDLSSSQMTTVSVSGQGDVGEEMKLHVKSEPSNDVLEEGFVEAQSDNLPVVDMFMVARYLSENCDYVAAEIRGIKRNKSGRESHGDEAIGYVQLQREHDVCTVKGRVTPERCRCTVTCNEAESRILTVACEECAASRGGCKHSIAFLMWLYRRTDEPTPTSLKCYWKISNLSGVGTSLKFIKAKDFGSQQLQSDVKCDADMFFEKVKKRLRESQVQCQLAAYVTDTS